MEKISLAIHKYLKKMRERVIIELKVSNYNKTSFYIALVYNSKIDLYKILYVPIDIVDGNDIKNYACYQFIDLVSVEYILRMISEVKKYNGEKILVNKKIKSYEIEINLNLLNDFYQFKATQFIPREWTFMFDMIVTLFEHVPHIVSEVCQDMLTLFKDSSEDILYNESFEFDLVRDDLSELKKFVNGKLLDFGEISYLERVNGKFFAIISNYIVIVNYNRYGIINVYCECDNYVDYVYTVIAAIRENIQKRFYRLMIIDSDDENKRQYYLCYGINDKGFKVIHGSKEKNLSLSLYKQGLVEFIYDEDGKLEKQVKRIINNF